MSSGTDEERLPTRSPTAKIQITKSKLLLVEGKDEEWIPSVTPGQSPCPRLAGGTG